MSRGRSSCEQRSDQLQIDQSRYKDSSWNLWVIPVRRALIFSTVLVLGPTKGVNQRPNSLNFCRIPLPFVQLIRLTPTICQAKLNRAHTNGTDDGGTAEVLRRNHLGVELGVPLQLHPVAQVVKRAAGCHFDILNEIKLTVVAEKGESNWNKKDGEKRRRGEKSWI